VEEPAVTTDSLQGAATQRGHSLVEVDLVRSDRDVLHAAVGNHEAVRVDELKQIVT